MKKKLIYSALAVLCLGTIFYSCSSYEEKVEKDIENVSDANPDLNELNDEFPIYKMDAELTIVANEKRIAELRGKLNKPGTAPFDEMRKHRIDELEIQNANLRAKLVAYEKEHSDWETFKREFKHDLDGLGKAFEDIGKDNSK